MIEKKVTKQGKWNSSNIFMLLQGQKGLPFEQIQMGYNTLTAADKTGLFKLEICNCEEGETVSTFHARISAQNRKIEKSIAKQIEKLFKPAKFEDAEQDKYSLVVQGLKKLLVANGFKIISENGGKIELDNFTITFEDKETIKAE